MNQPPPTPDRTSRPVLTGGWSAPAPPAREEGPALAGLAELTGALARAAHAPAVLVTVDTCWEDDALAYRTECDAVPRVILGADLLSDETRLTGALAHEIAHHVLGHGEGAVRAWQRGTHLAIGMVLGAVAAGLPDWVIIAVGAAAVVLHLITARLRRLEEYDADAHSVRLLDAAGLDGYAIVTAALAAIPRDSRWYRLIGWIGGSHPTPAARCRRLAAGRRTPAMGLLMWRTTNRR